MLALPLCLWHLGTLYLYDFDEAWNAQIAKEMVQTGDWLFLHWRGEAFWDKPPLFFWLVATSFSLFGIGEWQARLPAALCTWGSVLLTYALARRIAGSHRPAFLAGLILLTTIPFLQTGRQAMLDVPLTFCLLLAALGWQGGRAAVLVGLGFGAGWLVKGAASAILVPILGLYGAWSGRGPGRRNPYLYGGILLGLLPVLAWYGLQGQEYGPAFFQRHLGYHVLQRAGQAIEGHGGAWWHYLWELGARYWPWVVLLPFAIIRATADGKVPSSRPSAPGPRPPPLFQLGTVWAGCVLLAFTLVQTKLPWYLTLIYPGLALVLGVTLTGGSITRSLRLGLAGGSLALALAALFYGFLLGSPLRLGELLPWRLDYVPVLAWLAAVLGVAAASRHWLWMITGGSYVAAWMLVALVGMDGAILLQHPGPWARAFPNWHPMKRPVDLRPVAAVVRAQVPPGATVYFLYPFARPSFLFYSHHPDRLVGEEALAAAWARGEVRYAVVIGSNCGSWPQRLPGSAVLGRVGADQGEYCLLGRKGRP